MIIKEKSNRSRAFKDVFYFMKTRAKLKIFFVLSVCVLISLSLVSFGIFLNRNKKIDSIVHLGADVLENKFDFLGNYFSSFNANSNLFILDIKFKHLDKINNLVNIANETGYITEVLKTEEFPAKITFADKKYKVKLSLTGQYLDHVESERNSFNVEVKDDQTIMGMSKFKLLIPSTRGYLADWVAHEMQKNEGLIVPRFDFVTIKINGESKGVFSIEESYNTDLIENNNLRDGIIFKPGLNGIVVLNKKKVNKDVNLKNRVISLKNLWQSFLNNEISPEEIFDLEKFALDYATTDLLSGLHSKHLLNLRYYYNPITNLIEPISREFGFMRNGYALNGKDKTKIFIKSLFENSELSEADKKFHKKIFKSLTFQKIYLKSLDRISNKSYLDSFFKSIKKEMYEKEKIIYNKTPFYSYPKRFLYENQKIIQKFLNPTDQLVLGDLFISNNKLSLKFTNKSFFPVKINYIIINDSIISRPLSNEYIVASSYGESHIVDFDFLNDGKTIIENVNFYYNILGLDSDILNHKVSKINDEPLSFNPTTMSNSFLDLDFIIINPLKKEITIPKGLYELDMTFSIPDGYVVNIEAGVNINLIKTGGLISYSKLNLKGTKNSPIIITSSDLSNTGIVIINTEETSNFNYVEISNLSNFSSSDWNLTGSLTFYNSDVIFNNCKISNNNSGDDLLNIVKSNFEILNSEFNNSFADALDADFCNGKIINTSFNNSGNDAIDISGSNLFVKNIIINNSLDKALSAGEKSIINGNTVKIINSEIAICSKDLSEINITDYYLKNNRIGLAAFQKKSKFGPGFLKLSNGISEGNSIDYLIELNSFCMVDDIIVSSNDKNIKDLFYGIKYGKSSKQ